MILLDRFFKILSTNFHRFLYNRIALSVTLALVRESELNIRYVELFGRILFVTLNKNPIEFLIFMNGKKTGSKFGVISFV